MTDPPTSQADQREHGGAARAIVPRPPGLAARVREAWQHRALAMFFARRFNQKRYLRTWLGPLWLFLRPGMIVISQLFVFGGVLKVATGGIPYPVFFLVTFSAWHLLSESAYWATRSLEFTRSVLRRMYLPRGTVIVASLAPAVIDYLIVLAMLALTVVGYLIADGTFYLTFDMETWLVPAGIGLLMLYGLGVGLWLSVPGTSKRDVRFTLRYALNFWYFLTPVAYPVSQVPSGLLPVVELNPITAPIQMVKIGFLSNTGDTIPTLALVSTFAWLVPLLIGGAWVFFRAEAAALDHI